MIKILKIYRNRGYGRYTLDMAIHQSESDSLCFEQRLIDATNYKRFINAAKAYYKLSFKQLSFETQILEKEHPCVFICYHKGELNVRTFRVDDHNQVQLNIGWIKTTVDYIEERLSLYREAPVLVRIVADFNLNNTIHEFHSDDSTELILFKLKYDA